MKSYFDGLLRYFEFAGRSSRAQYWLFQLFFVLVSLAAGFADYKLGYNIFDPRHPGLFSTFVAIFHVVPQITVTVRRLHDIGKSGWWYLLLFVPLVGLLVLVWTCYASEPGSNDFGDPASSAPPRDSAGPPFGRAVRMGSSSPRQAAPLGPQSIATQRFI